MFFRGLVIGLSIVLGCLFLAAVAQLYYLLWWKKRRTHAEIESDQSNYAKELLHRMCWNQSSSLHTSNEAVEIVRVDAETKGQEVDLEMGTGKDVVLKTFEEEGVESELLRLHNLAGPPRFLFTIKEETKEDLESEDGKSRGDRSKKGSRTRSLSDLMLAIDTPFLTPVASSPKKSPLNSLDSYKLQGFNPLFESSTELELNRVRSSPPPKFKFLRDAEDKLCRRLIEEAQKKTLKNNVSVQESEVKDSPNPTMVTQDKDIVEGSFLRFIKNKERELQQQQPHRPQFPSGSSQVLPLASSPTTFRPLEKASMVH
ncbi:hypothetical protein L6164_021870 [Bauhinia variegata]|uniref:Uncharacterized protein n=1 Tax=Bauhinia variegata TaxID=167791 RepID=A0ACB9MDD0_BAUVA|nr:hypothetical protein L6164_021870 [Bauhinia variegata]